GDAVRDLAGRGRDRVLRPQRGLEGRGQGRRAGRLAGGGRGLGGGRPLSGGGSRPLSRGGNGARIAGESGRRQAASRDPPRETDRRRASPRTSAPSMAG